MHRIGAAVLAAAALTVALWVPSRVDAAGIYEDASAESALLLFPDRVTVRATLEVSGGASEGTVYRLMGAFPIGPFMVAIDQPFVVVTDSSDIETGAGDLCVRARARLWRGDRRAIYLLGYLAAGTGDDRFFPYSSRTVDVNASAGYADTLGVVTAWVIGGFTRVGNVPEDSVVAASHTSQARASAGATLQLGARARVGAGALLLFFDNDARRDLLFATGNYRWSDTLSAFVSFQAETGPVGERVNDWGAVAGFGVEF